MYLNSTNIHKVVELGSVCLCYRLLSWPSRGFTAVKEWSSLSCPALTGAGNTPRNAYFCFCRHVWPRGIHPSMKEWMFFFLFSHGFLSLLPLPFSLNPDSWIELERHAHDNDRAVNQQGESGVVGRLITVKVTPVSLFFVCVFRTDPIKKVKEYTQTTWITTFYWVYLMQDHIDLSP